MSTESYLQSPLLDSLSRWLLTTEMLHKACIVQNFYAAILPCSWQDSAGSHRRHLAGFEKQTLLQQQRINACYRYVKMFSCASIYACRPPVKTTRTPNNKRGNHDTSRLPTFPPMRLSRLSGHSHFVVTMARYQRHTALSMLKRSECTATGSGLITNPTIGRPQAQ